MAPLSQKRGRKLFDGSGGSETPLLPRFTQLGAGDDWLPPLHWLIILDPRQRPKTRLESLPLLHNLQTGVVKLKGIVLVPDLVRPKSDVALITVGVKGPDACHVTSSF